MNTSLIDKNKDQGYNPTEIQDGYLETIDRLRQQLELATDPEERADIQANIDYIVEDMANVDKVVN